MTLLKKNTALGALKHALKQRVSEEPSPVAPQEVTPVKTPTEEKRRQHELSHLPYVPWCTACASHKARSDVRQPSDHTRCGTSVLSFDLSFTDRESDNKDKLVA